MENCAYCDQEYDEDDWIEADYDEPECPKCETKFCSPSCLKEHGENCDSDGP